MTETKTYAIHSDPDILNGTPVFVGTRVPFRTLIDHLAGPGLEEFLEQFPSVSRGQVIAALRQSEEALVSDACSDR